MDRLIFFFLILGIIFSCDKDELVNPHYPAKPSIEFNGIEFAETPQLGEGDTLILTIKYRDGDRDFGFDIMDPKYSMYPYNPYFYFLADGSGDTSKVVVENFWVSNHHYELLLPNQATGKIVTDKTRNLPNYGYLPIYDPNTCNNYSYSDLLIPEETNAVDASYNIIDTLEILGNNYYSLEEEFFLYLRNENHSNIFVEFYYSDDGINFNEYNWFEEFCIDFDGRIPALGDYIGTIRSGPYKIKVKTPWEGEIRYAMTNSSFLALFKQKKLKLKVKIKDRALHTSNTIETPVFTLDEIRKN